MLAAFLAVGNVMAQDAHEKKKGGFWNKVKKGVESATGLDVSKETLFVYPKIGEWKMELGYNLPRDGGARKLVFITKEEHLDLLWSIFL